MHTYNDPRSDAPFLHKYATAQTCAREEPAEPICIYRSHSIFSKPGKVSIGSRYIRFILLYDVWITKAIAV